MKYRILIKTHNLELREETTRGQNSKRPVHRYRIRFLAHLQEEAKKNIRAMLGMPNWSLGYSTTMSFRDRRRAEQTFMVLRLRLGD